MSREHEDQRFQEGERLLRAYYSEEEATSNIPTLVEEGFAVPLEIAPNTTFASDVSAASSAARRSHRGLWAACPERTAPVTQKSSSSQKSSGK